MRITFLALSLLCTAAGCNTVENDDFCNNETPCDPDSDKPYCDFAGEFGPSNTCIGAPVDGGPRFDVDPLAPDASDVDAAEPTFCESEAAPDCNDAVACTDDVCNDDTEGCTNLPNHANCGGSTPFCHPANGCIEKTCRTADECDDGVFCNGVEVCDEKLGCVAGTPPVVSDGVGCTVDSCDETLDVIKHVADHDVCDDGMFCNGDEVCNPTLDCQSGPAPVLSDGVGCTIDSCDEVADEVVHIADDTLCIDSLHCNGTEMCSPTVDCVAGAPVDCTPHPVCHAANSCSEALDECNPTMASLGYSWQIFGTGGSSGNSAQCGEYDVVYTNSNACDATHGFEFRCSFDDDGKLAALVASTGGFVFGCLGIAGPLVETGCSETMVYVPEFDAYQIFKCCHE